MKINSIGLALTAAVIGLGFSAPIAEALPPSQVPSGYQAYLDRKAKTTKTDCCKKECCKSANASCCAKPTGMAVDGGNSAPLAFHHRKHGGGGYSGR